MARLLGACCCALLAAVLLVAAAAADDVFPSGGGGGARIRQPSARAEYYRGRKVGARTEVWDVERDREVQELGRFSVAEYNRQQRVSGGERLEFTRVVAAQRQVVSGLKYYLRIAAAAEEGGAPGNAGGGGGERVFDAVVVVKPWLDRRTLLRFKPADVK